MTSSGLKRCVRSASTGKIIYQNSQAECQKAERAGEPKTRYLLIAVLADVRIRVYGLELSPEPTNQPWAFSSYMYGDFFRNLKLK